MISSMAFKAEINEIGDGLLAISYLNENTDKPHLLPDIIFLDLSMPVMDGWEFLKEYALLQPRLKKKIALFIVSSSISPHEVERSKTFQVVTDFLIKPLAKGKIREIFEELETAS
jgi:CheY-like chemotaxis protein